MKKKATILLIVFLLSLVGVIGFSVWKYQFLTDGGIDGAGRNTQGHPDDLFLGSSSTTQFSSSSPETGTVIATSTNLSRRSVTEEQYKRMLNEWNMRDAGTTYIALYTDDYTIVYSNLFKTLHVTVGSEPFEEYRVQAEMILAKILDASNLSELCRYDFTVSRKTWATDYRHEDVGPIDCPGSVR